MKNVIITGPTGAVGVSLIYELIKEGYNITAVCRPSSKRIGNIPKNSNVKIIECDQRNLLSLTTILTDQYDYFYHFAWDGTYGASRQDIDLQLSNIKCTVDAVKLAKILHCKAFIGAGSQSEFGHVNGILHPYMPCNPDNGYGIAKLAASSLSRILCSQMGIRHEWCRIVSLYGPFDGGHTLIMSTIKSLLRGKKQEFTKGDQVWDYIYSKDAAKAFRLVAERGKDGAIYCLGSGKTRILKDFILEIRNQINPNIELNFGGIDYYPNQVMHLEADISNLELDTGFKCEYSFENGISETIKWVKEKNEYESKK